MIYQSSWFNVRDFMRRFSLLDYYEESKNDERNLLFISSFKNKWLELSREIGFQSYTKAEIYSKLILKLRREKIFFIFILSRIFVLFGPFHGCHQERKNASGGGRQRCKIIGSLNIEVIAIRLPHCTKSLTKNSPLGCLFWCKSKLWTASLRSSQKLIVGAIAWRRAAVKRQAPAIFQMVSASFFKTKRGKKSKIPDYIHE